MTLELRAELDQLRQGLWDAWDSATPGEKASLARMLTVVLDKLDGLPSGERSKVDELLARRSRSPKRSA